MYPNMGLADRELVMGLSLHLKFERSINYSCSATGELGEDM